MKRKHIQGVVKLDEIIKQFTEDPYYYHTEYIGVVRGSDVTGILQASEGKSWEREYVYKEQDNFGYKFRGIIWISVGYEYYLKFKYIV